MTAKDRPGGHRAPPPGRPRSRGRLLGLLCVLAVAALAVLGTIHPRVSSQRLRAQPAEPVALAGAAGLSGAGSGQGGAVTVEGALSTQLLDAGDVGSGAVGSEPVPAGFPSARTTGVPDGTHLRSMGGLTLDQPGTVLDGALIIGCVTIRASDVTITRSKIVCAQHKPALRIVGSATGTVISAVEIDGGGVSPAGIEGRDFTATHVNIHDTGDGAHLGGGASVEDCYIHDLAHQPNIHHDDLQTVSGTTGAHILVQHNTLQAVSAEFNGNSSYHLGSGNLSDVLVEENYMDGGSFTIQVANSPNQQDIVFRQNQFGRHDRFGIISITQNGNAVSFLHNVWQDNGRPVHL